MSMHNGIALLTGASSGIGAVYATRMAERGYDLILVARRLDRLERLANTLRTAYGRTVHTVQADLADDLDLARVDHLLRETPQVQALINCAGLGALGPTQAVEAATIERMLKVNVNALTQLSLTAGRRFAAARDGLIINIGSVVALLPAPTAGSYSGSKAYVLNFTRALQAELAPSNVRVQLVMPGPVRTEFFGDTPAPFPDHLFMTPETLVDAALRALDQQEWVCFPSLHDLSAWQNQEAARINLIKALSHSGEPAARYLV